MPISDRDVSQPSDCLRACQRGELRDLGVVKNDRGIAIDFGRDERELIHLGDHRRKHDWSRVGKASVQDEFVIAREPASHLIEGNIVIAQSVGRQLMVELLVVNNISLLLYGSLISATNKSCLRTNRSNEELKVMTGGVRSLASKNTGGVGLQSAGQSRVWDVNAHVRRHECSVDRLI